MSNSHKCSSADLSLSYVNSVRAEEIRTIKKRLRLAMDGVVSSSLRERGMNDYRIIFGCSVQSLKRIAEHTPHETDLADYLWQENIRESKILATMIYPVGMFDLDKACRWSSQIPYTEIAEHLAMNLLCRTSFAVDFAINRLQQDDSKQQVVALLTLQRVVILQNDSIIEAKQRVVDSLLEANHWSAERQVAELSFNLWKRLLRVSPETNHEMLESIRKCETIETQQKVHLLEALQIEMEYI